MLALWHPPRPSYPPAVNSGLGRPGSPGSVIPSMTVYPVSRRVYPLALALLAAMCGSGCTSVLSTASLRDLVLGIDDRSGDAAIPSGPEEEVAASDAEDDSADAERRAAAIEEAIARLSKVDDLDDAARATLVTTLQRTDQEDWPVVVDAFAESLADSPPPHVVAKADLSATATPKHEPPADISDEPSLSPEEPSPAPEAANPEPKLPTSADVPPAPLPIAAVVVTPTPVPPQPAEEPASLTIDPEPAAPSVPEFTIRNACFASRVQAWGVLDRFAADRFRPGQDVIVYFELEGLSAGESAAGHTTCIDSRLRLVTNDDTLVHEWTFEPIAETCRARRHDYFARYVVKIPAAATPGRHSVELAVTDTLTGQQAVETVNLEILAPSPLAE